jgi:hypothetical protein
MMKAGVPLDVSLFRFVTERNKALFVLISMIS